MNLFRLLMCLTVAFASSTGCSHKQKVFESDLKAGNCDQALNNVPEHDPSLRLLKQSETTAKKAVSYTYIGANYGVEVLWDTVAGTVAFVALYSPAILASVAVDSARQPVFNGQTGGLCFPLKHMDAVLSPPLGRKAAKATEEWRCPDLGSLIRSLRGVASCFENRGGKADLERAQSSLKMVQSSEGFYSCFKSEQKELLQKDLRRIENKLALAQ